MSTPRPFIAVLFLAVVIAAAGLVFPDSSSPAQSSSTQQKQEQQRTTACPEVGGTSDGSEVVTTFVAGDAAGGSGTIEGIGPEPVALPEPGRASSATADPAGSSIVVTAQGAATGATATMREYLDLADEGRGLAMTACLAPAPQWWFVGVSGAAGQLDRLLLANPTPSPAVVAVDVFGPTGRIDVVGVGGIALQPGASATVRVDSLIPGLEPATLRVHTTSGLVSAAFASTVIDGLIPRGADFLPAAADPAEHAVVPGVLPGAGPRMLVLTAPDSDAVVRIDYLTADGLLNGSGDPVPVPAGNTVSLDIAAATAGVPAAVIVSATSPVVAAVRSTVEGELQPGATGVMNRVPIADFAWTAGQPPIGERWHLPFSGAAGTQACALLSSDGAASSANVTVWAANGAPSQQTVEVPANSAVCAPVPVAASAATVVVVDKIAGSGALRAAALAWGASSDGPLVTASLGSPAGGAVTVPPAHPDPLVFGGG